MAPFAFGKEFRRPAMPSADGAAFRPMAQGASGVRACIVDSYGFAAEEAVGRSGRPAPPCGAAAEAFSEQDRACLRAAGTAGKGAGKRWRHIKKVLLSAPI